MNETIDTDTHYDNLIRRAVQLQNTKGKLRRRIRTWMKLRAQVHINRILPNTPLNPSVLLHYRNLSKELGYHDRRS